MQTRSSLFKTIRPGAAGIGRRMLLALPATLALPAAALPPRRLQFPRDHGAHPDMRTEWWYLTGALSAQDKDYGFQITFFRSRVEGTQAMQSRFAAKQLVFAHAALTDVQGKKLLHDQRIAREGFGVAQMSVTDTDVALRDWSLKRDAKGYSAIASGPGFALLLQLTETQPLLLQGKDGLSRKGPDAKQASYYYSKPQLKVSGSVTLAGKPMVATGTAWLDHEWSEELLHPDAVGWDWIGMNLDDGSALTAFRLRRKDADVANDASLWDGGSFRTASGQQFGFSPGEVVFSPQRFWTSPISKARYPVEWIVRTPANFYTVKAVIDNQELDSRASTGAIYWEGLSDLFDSNGKKVGRGYLEMTGYAAPLTL